MFEVTLEDRKELKKVFANFNRDKSDEEIDKYLNSFKLERVSVQSIKTAEMGTIDTSEFPIFEVLDVEADQHKKEEIN